MKRVSIALLAALLALAALVGALAEGVELETVMASFGLGEEMMALTEEDLTDVYGIDPADVGQFAAAIHDSGIKADEIVLVQAVDEEAAGRVQAALEGRFQDKLNELEGYLPEEYAVAAACKVEADGLFVAMIVSPDAEALTGLWQEAIAAK